MGLRDCAAGCTTLRLSRARIPFVALVATPHARGGGAGGRPPPPRSPPVRVDDTSTDGPEFSPPPPRLVAARGPKTADQLDDPVAMMRGALEMAAAVKAGVPF